MTCQEIQKMVTPYIEDQLNDKELEIFISHVHTCPKCYEELETYFIISLATQVLDGSGSAKNYNIKALLEQNMRENEKRLKRRKLRFWGVLFLILFFLIIDIIWALHWLRVVDFLPFI